MYSLDTCNSLCFRTLRNTNDLSCFYKLPAKFVHHCSQNLAESLFLIFKIAKGIRINSNVETETLEILAKDQFREYAGHAVRLFVHVYLPESSFSKYICSSAKYSLLSLPCCNIMSLEQYLSCDIKLHRRILFRITLSISFSKNKALIFYTPVQYVITTLSDMISDLMHFYRTYSTLLLTIL